MTIKTKFAKTTFATDNTEKILDHFVAFLVLKEKVAPSPKLYETSEHNNAHNNAIFRSYPKSGPVSRIVTIFTPAILIETLAMIKMSRSCIKTLFITAIGLPSMKLHWSSILSLM